jgi:hypothetical protein
MLILWMMKEITINNADKPIRLFYSKRTFTTKTLLFSVYPVDKETEQVLGKSKSFIFNAEDNKDISWDGPQRCDIHIRIAKALAEKEALSKYR